MRSTLRGLLVGLALAVASPAPIASATSLAPLTPEQFTDAATYIVQGEVTDVWAEVDDRGMVWTRARVEVDRLYKGPGNPEVLIVESLGGAIGQHYTHIEGQVRFSPGEEIFVFLSEVDAGRRLTPVGMFTGKYTIRRAPGETRKHLLRWHGNDEEVFDHRFLPHPKPESRVYLDNLVEQVETRLDTGWDGKPIPGISPVKLEAINTPTRRMR